MSNCISNNEKACNDIHNPPNASNNCSSIAFSVAATNFITHCFTPYTPEFFHASAQRVSMVFFRPDCFFTLLRTSFQPEPARLTTLTTPPPS
jgi:hypothetical protein